MDITTAEINDRLLEIRNNLLSKIEDDNYKYAGSNSLKKMERIVAKSNLPETKYSEQTQNNATDTSSETFTEISINIPWEDLLNQVNKRTSYIGRSRKTQDGVHQLLDLALTSDDKSILIDMGTEASGYVFERINGYTHNQTDCHVVDNDGIKYKIYMPLWFNNNAIQMLGSSILEALINFVMFRWFTLVYPDEAKYYADMNDANLNNITQRINTQKEPINRKYFLF